MNYLKTAATVLALAAIIRAVAFFSGSETAYLSTSKLKMRRLTAEKRKGSQKAALLRANMDELLTVVLIGTNFMNTLASSLATSLAISIAGKSGVGIATVLITFAATVFGQIIPKTAAGIYPEDTVCRNSFLLYMLKIAMFPVVRVFTLISSLVSSVAGEFFKADDVLVTEDELKTLIDIGETEGTLEHGESRMLYRIFEFSDLNVHDIMKHRSLIKAIPKEAARKEVVESFRESGLSMLPVYAENREKIVGVIHYKTVLLSSKSDETKNYAERTMKDVLFVPETLSALELLIIFRKKRTEFAVALNEQGQTAGVVTMDDIMRVVFGRMSTLTHNELPPEERIRLVSPTEFVVPGDIKLEDINSIFRLNLESDGFSTLGGWLLEKIGSLPSTGELFKQGNMLFIVEDQAHRRILSVRIKFL